MSYAVIAQFDTEEEAVSYMHDLAAKGELPIERLTVFDDKDHPELGKRYSVNVD